MIRATYFTYSLSSLSVGRICSSIVGAICLLAFSAVGSSAQTAPKTYYVSNSGSGGDGTTWQTAWKYLNQIDWSKIQPGDTITLDGGPYGMSYTGSLVIGKSGTYSAPIKITTSTETGHSGRVSLYGSSSSGNYAGIDFGNNQYVKVEGRTIPSPSGGFSSKSLNIFGYPYYGVKVGQDSYNVSLKNVEISANGGATTGAPANKCGLLVQGRWPSFENLSIYNNTDTNVVVESQYGGYGPTFKKCWIGNQPVGSYGPGGIVTTWVAGNGVKVKDTYRGGFSWFYFYDCVFGPGLTTGIEFGQKNGGLSVSNSTFINPETAGVKKVATTMPDLYYSMISLQNCTCFLTPLNRNGVAHSNLDFVIGQDSVYNSIFWGGTVNVTGTKTLGSGNFQNRTTGNTVVLSGAQVDPGFEADVSTITADDWSRLFSTSFRLKTGAAAAGKGATVNSVNQVLAF